MGKIIWEPAKEQVERSNLTAFMHFVADCCDQRIESYDALYEWSLRDPACFWEAVWGFTEMSAARAWDRVLVNGDRMPGAKWFQGARLNFAENLLRFRNEKESIVFWNEQGARKRITFRELHDQVARLVHALREAGVEPGDRVAGYLPNLPEAVVAMLAAASIGALWSSCSPDFGIQGVLDRFGQIEPKILFCADGYFYNGKRHDSLVCVKEILEKISSVEKAVVVPYTDIALTLEEGDRVVLYPDFLGTHTYAAIDFEQLPFDHPLYVMYSSGTTGLPKCMVHSAGGTLIQHRKEHVLHCDLDGDDKIFYYTTCGWMMWNWLVSALASGATVMLFDGAPFHPAKEILWDFVQEEGITLFGTSAKYLAAMEKSGLEPAETHDLSSLKTILSTGSPLAPESFDYVYRSVKSDVRLSSISGGTDIISCFALGNPNLPVRRGELQCRGLGMKVEIFDPSGKALWGEKGELVCSAPFPSMPVGFWNDREDEKYRSAYFDRYPGVWAHGDLAELRPEGGVIIYGRSDAVLNPGGVRIGTAEIYRVVERFDEVIESLAVGQEWKGDVRVILFVHLKEGAHLDKGLEDRIRKRIRKEESPRHVPAKIIQVDAIPRTLSGKIVELAVRDVIHGRPVENRDALANPEVLAQYEDLPELKGD